MSVYQSDFLLSESFSAHQVICLPALLYYFKTQHLFMPKNGVYELMHNVHINYFHNFAIIVCDVDFSCDVQQP